METRLIWNKIVKK